jgi:ribosomal protein S12 methylthiotransferase
MMNAKERVFLISLGCAKNLVDSENMLGMLKSNGFDLASGIDEAEVAVVNTCGFIRPAVEEAIDTILEVVALKKRGALKKVVVTGCFVQRYGYKLRREIPEVDGWLGTGEFYRVADVMTNGRSSAPAPFFIGRPTYLADHSVPRIPTEHFYSAYLKVAEGCSHRCSYCIIPSLRGPFRSRMPESLMVEAEEMISRGVKEINLVAQDTTMYGKDLGEGVCLEDLLDRLVKVDGIRWIRLLYCYPNGISNRLLELIDSEEVICPYLDVPQQHVNEKILRAMGRNFGKETPWALIERIRSRKRRISLRMTLMVGFPGETEEMFNELCDFVRMAQVDHLGVFIFSAEKGAPAACLQSTVVREEAERRRDTIMALQADISKKINQRMVGYTVPVLVEGPSHETDLLLKGRTATMAPDVDAQVLINKGKGVQGKIMPVLIRQAHAYDLVGEIKG